MSTGLLYHAFGVRRYQYVRQSFGAHFQISFFTQLPQTIPRYVGLPALDGLVPSRAAEVAEGSLAKGVTVE